MRSTMVPDDTRKRVWRGQRTWSPSTVSFPGRT